MKQVLIFALLIISGLLSGTVSYAASSTNVGRLEARDSTNRLLYLGGTAYFLPIGTEVTFTDNRIVDPMLLQPGVAIQIQWADEDGKKTIKHLHIYGDNPEIPR